jgi:hypothetical protein
VRTGEAGEELVADQPGAGAVVSGRQVGDRIVVLLRDQICGQAQCQPWSLSAVSVGEGAKHVR